MSNLIAGYEISEVDGKFVVAFEGRVSDRCNSLAAAERAIANHKMQREKIANQRAAAAAREAVEEAKQLEIDKRLNAGNKPVKHKHMGVETPVDNSKGQPSVEWGIATWSDGFQCVYRWYGDAREGNEYSAD